MTTPAGRIGYLPGLDGVRAVALIGVLLFHAGHLRGGFLSVDLFFVLSGFLITSLLLAEWKASGHIDLRRFWSRRLRRLVPAALVVLAGTAVYAAVALDPTERHRFRGDALAALFDVANWRAIRTGTDYWSTFGSPSPLRHMWSLSVEEQLYLVWPAVVLGVLWFARRRRWGLQTLFVAALALAGASMTAMALLVERGDTARAYYGTDTRASAVLLGGAAAVALSGRTWTAARRLPRSLGRATPVAIAALAVGWVWADGRDLWLYRWGFPLGSLAATVVVAAIASDGAPRLARTLEVTPLRELGRISYGVYLWHWPVFVVLDDPIGGSRYLQTGVRCAVSILLGVASSRLIEAPVRSGSVPTRVWRPLALGSVAAVAAGIGAATLGAHAPPGGGSSSSPSRGVAVGAPTVLLLGDSEAYNLSFGAEEVLADRVAFAHHARIGCGMGPGLAVDEHGDAVQADADGRSCLESNAWLTLAIDEVEPEVIVVNEGAWDVLDREVDGRRLRFGTPEWDDAVSANFATMLARFGLHGARVVALASPCFEPGGDAVGESIRAEDSRVRRWNELLRTVAPTVGVEVLAYDELFCGRPRADQPARTDGVHLTEAGAAEVWRWLAPLLRLGLDER